MVPKSGRDGGLNTYSGTGEDGGSTTGGSNEGKCLIRVTLYRLYY